MLTSAYLRLAAFVLLSVIVLLMVAALFGYVMVLIELAVLVIRSLGGG